MFATPTAGPAVTPGPRGNVDQGDSAPLSHAPLVKHGLGLDVMPKVAEVPAISPRMSAVFGGLFGMAVVASVVALLIQVFPVENQRAIAAGAAAPAEPAVTPSLDRPRAVKRQRTLVPGPWRLEALGGTHLVVHGKMERRSFIAALDESGVPKKQVYRILKAMEGVKSFDRTGKNDKFGVAMKRAAKDVVAFEYEVDPTEIYQARMGDDGLLKGARLDMHVRQQDFATAVYIGQDVLSSLKAADLEAGVLEVIDGAFNGRTSHEAFEEGSVLKVVVVETTALGHLVRYDRVKALEYRPADPSKSPLRAYWFQGEQSSGYVDEKGRRPSNRGWRTPVPGAPVTSHFNPKRMHPVLKQVMPHNGTDYGAPAGTPVYAAYRGSVSFVGMRGPSGNLVLIDHPGSIETGYAHLSRFADGVTQGAKVGTRQLIGYVGSTGRSTGPHLHFSAKRDGKFFDAMELRMDALELLPVAERSAFLQQKALFDATLEAIPLPEPPPEAPNTDREASSDDAEAQDEIGEGEPTPSASGDAAGDPSPPKAHATKKAGAVKNEPDGEELVGGDLSGDIE